MRKKKTKTMVQLRLMKTRQDWFDFITKMDEIQSRVETAKQIGCSKHTLRQLANEVGIVKQQGRPVRTKRFKDED